MESSDNDIVSGMYIFVKFREERRQVVMELTYRAERNRRDQAYPGPRCWGAENRAIWPQDP